MIREVIREALERPLETVAAFLTLVGIAACLWVLLVMGSMAAQP